MDKSSSYGGPPQSTIGSSARRIQAQLPAEPPACVQNAMMRRDKQPFTYTPGGIDLSQIKSPRMAKRISRNAQSEGVSSQPKLSPLAQNNNNNSSSSNSNGNSQPAVSPAATLGAAAMGMPFQVFPTGPPAPPPPPPPSMAKKPTPGHTNGNSTPAPPPPPPPAEKQTPRSQVFEAPPMGCRPEIKIPPNPMSNLRKAPRPQPKNDFWIEEYRNEKRNDEPDRPCQMRNEVPDRPSQLRNEVPDRPIQIRNDVLDRPSQIPVYSSREADEEVAKNTLNRTNELTVRNESPKKRSPSPSNLTKPLENGSRVSSIKTPPVYGQSPVPPNLPPPITPTKVSQPPSDSSTNSTATPQQDREQSTKPRQISPPSTQSPSTNGHTSTNNTTQNSCTATVKPPTPQKPAPQPLGSLYIPPVHEVFANSKQALLNQASPPWMSSRQNSVKEQPEWVHKEDSDILQSKAQTCKPNSNESTAKSSEPIAAAPSSSIKAVPVPQQQQQQQQHQTPQPTPPASRPQTIEPPSPYQPAISQTHYIQLQNPVTKISTPPIVQQSLPQPATMPANRSYPQTPVYVQNQMYSPQPAGSQKERIIPIQIEQSPIKAPASAPSFAPPPYYSPGPQYSNVQSPLTVGYPGPHSGFTTPTAMFTNPNHFVNQGYNNINYPPTSPQVYQQHHQHYQQQPSTPQQLQQQQQQQQLQQQQHQHMMHQQRIQQQTPAQQPGGVRIIPINVESGDNGASSTTVRGPLSQSPAIIQSDPRSSSNPQTWNGNVTPNQSRSFRVLQQITDTMEDGEPKSTPTTPKPAASEQSNSADEAESQVRRMQLSNDDKALMNRVKTQVDGEVFLHNEEDPRYRGAAIPSKAFRYLQNMTDGGQSSNSNNAGTANRTNQMFVQNRGNFSESEDDASQQYIPPSEQRVEEPKKYTGSAIPSRSFKMLQAMTQSDAPADTNSSDIEGNQNLPCNGDIRYSPYPYPPQPHYCCNPNWHYYDPNNPQYYPHPPPPLPPPHHAPGYYYPPTPLPAPPPPHGHYDRNAYYAGYMSPHHFYYPQEPCSPCTPPPYYQINQPQVAYCENVVPDSPTHTYVITTPPPRIVVTPTPDDSDAESVLSDFNSRANPLTRSQSSLKRLSERLANFSTSPEKMFPSDQDPKVRCSPSSPLNERYRTFEESTSSAPSSQSECSDSEEEGNQKQETAAATKESGTVIENQTEQKDDESSDESEDEETVGYDGNQPEHLPHQLSVIFEEDSVYAYSANPSRRASVCSNSSTLSDCSSTLANDLDDEDQDDEAKPSGGNHTDDDIDRLEEDDCSSNDHSQSSVKVTSNENKPDGSGESETEEETDDEGEEEDDLTDEEEGAGKKNTAEIRPNQGDDESTDEAEESGGSEESENETDDDKEDTEALNCKSTVGANTDENEIHTDVTVTITIPSMSTKCIDDNKDSYVQRQRKEEAKPNFTVDYEEDSHVSVSVSLPLKVKPAPTDVPNEEAKKSDQSVQEGTEKETQEDDDDEIDFWSQIGDNDDEVSRPSRSFSREFWSSREVSIDRDGGWNQEDEEENHCNFWNNENGPTEAIDLWKADPAVESFLGRQKNESTRDSIHFWQSENERMVYDLYSKRIQDGNTQKDCAAMDENNNSSTWDKLGQLAIADHERSEQVNQIECKPEKNISAKNSDGEARTDSSDEDSDDESEEYETTNTSKEESDVEDNELQANINITSVEEDLKAPEIILKKAPTAEKTDHKCNGILDAINTIAKEDDKTLSVRDRISIFEHQSTSPLLDVPTRQKTRDSSNRLRPPSGMKLSCDESEAEDDSGVTSDMSKHISEVETDSECFPEMQKMTRYQRAATHSRLFKLLQDESNNGDSEDEEAEQMPTDECSKMHNGHNNIERTGSPRHPEISKYKGSSFEDNSSTSNTATDRRDRLSLPIRHQSSSGIESLSSSTSSASPVSGVTNDKLAEELVLSLLMKKKGRLFRNLPLEKLHAAALKILQEDLESNGTISSTEDNIITVDSTPALTPQEFKSEYQNSYSDYYDTWSETNGKASPHDCGQPEMAPSKVFRNPQDHTTSRKPANWSARCPRVLSNKSISRLAEVRESDTPDPTSTTSRSRPPSRASNQSPFTPMSGLIEDLPSGSRSAYRQFKLSNL